MMGYAGRHQRRLLLSERREATTPNAVDFLMAHCNTTDRIRQYILFNVQWQVITLFQMGITTHPSHFSVGSTASSVWTCPYQDWRLDGISLTMFCKTL